MTIETYLHGAHRGELVVHVGICLTDDADSAQAYADVSDTGTVHVIEIDMGGLRVVQVDGYDRDTNESPADDDAASAAREYDADVIRFSDEDPMGQEHTTWRLLTQAAVDAIR